MPVIFWAISALLVGAVLFAGTKGWAYIQGKPQFIELSPIGGGFYLRPDAANAFITMRAAAQRDNIALIVNSAFRTQEEQVKLYSEYISGSRSALAAKPGYSNHQGGIAVDIAVGGDTSAVSKWLGRRASEFGFRRTVASEPWHYEYKA